MVWAGIAQSVRRYSDSLWVGRSGGRIPLEARFAAPVQTGPFFLNSFSFIYMKSIIKHYYSYNVLIYHVKLHFSLEYN